ncbi:nickel/cobalt transporter [Nitratireductor basaltis]|uniref:Nickel/cobalt efflux system n=1 Tax=Nitratireductor basaltis TaxID=472175 RepID=A0A084U867_9HYPH|nr:nickel/cobalt transporter [Nitratireductor basaltis]KFB09153.1 High-affinity nickel-transporter [Nitratireductor basaltis]
MKQLTWVALGLGTVGALLLVDPAFAQSSLGIGAAEPSISPTGPFAGLLQWVNTQQQEFYRALTGALKEMREDGSKLWFLIGLSFAYGVFHAAGPGHGKAVISSYMLANEVALRRGVMLSFASAMLQAVVAIAVMGLVFLVLRGTTVSMTDATRWLETASFALIAAFGAWLLYRKLSALLPKPRMHSLSAAETHHHHHGKTCSHAHHHPHEHRHADEELACPSCGHSHAPSPDVLTGEKLDWRTAGSAIAAVGMRPCSGALIVLTFSFLNALWLGGIVSVFAMAIGTAITVSVLATLAVTAKNVALRIAGDGRTGGYIHHAIEIGGAFLVLVLGLVLLAASLAA